MADQLRYDIEINGIRQTVLGLGGLEDALKRINKELRLTTSGDSFKKLGAEATNVKGHLLQLHQSLQTANSSMMGSQRASSNAAMALLNLNYVIRDSPYFFQNFALGVLAVGNNLNPLIDSFSRLRVEAGEKTVTTFALLKQALVGGAGISIAFSLVVTAIQAFVFWQANAKREADGTTESLKSQKDALQELTREQLRNALSRAEEKQMGEFWKLNDETRRRVAMGQMDMPGDLQSATNDVKKYKDALFMLGDIENVENRLRTNRQRLKDLNQDNLSIYKDIGTTYIGIKTTLEQWIAADERSLKVNKEKTKELKDQAEATRQIVELQTRAYTGREFGANEPKFFLGESDKPKNKWQINQTDRLKFPEYRGGYSTGRGSNVLGNGANNLMAQGLANDIKKVDMQLELAKNAADAFGNALVNALRRGKFEAEDLMAALFQLILQMGLNAMTGGMGGGASAVPGTPSKMVSFGGGSTQRIEVMGKLSARGNEIVANIEQLSTVRNRKSKVKRIGRD